VTGVSRADHHAHADQAHQTQHDSTQIHFPILQQIFEYNAGDARQNDEPDITGYASQT
jgi:hypothetical protein